MSGERETAADTGPLITLEKLSDGYHFIRLLYDKIVIPPTVLEELTDGQFLGPRAYLECYGIEDLLEVVEEEAGRECARSLGLRISGIAGQVVKASRAGLPLWPRTGDAAVG